ncbi:MAG TPA: hypothetical protein VIG71_02215 [Enteractinococcus sp.]
MAESSTTLEVIDIPEHCGNAPRKAIIRDFLVALYQRDTQQVLEHLRDDVEWHVVGTETLQGSDAVQTWLDQQSGVKSLSLTTVITHGTDCGADGTLEFRDGTALGFNHVLIFAGHSKTAKIKTIRSYLVPLGSMT